MQNRSIFLAVLAVAIVLFSLIFLYISRNGFNFNFIGTNTPDIPRITETGPGESIPAIWIWLSDTEILKEGNTTYLVGNLGGEGKLNVKVYLGTPDDRLGYAAAEDFTSFDKDFPERFPNWIISDISRIETDSANSNYAIVKIYLDGIPPIPDCDEICNNFLGKQIELLDNNKSLTDANLSETREGIVVGPAIQLIQVMQQ